MERHSYHVYMVASKSRVLYIGMTNDLERRIFEHKSDVIEGFSKQYRCHRLIYYESFDDVTKAINREKQLKRWNRDEESIPDRTSKSYVGGFGRRVVHSASVRA